MKDSYYDLKQYPQKGDLMVAVDGEEFNITIGKSYEAQEDAGVGTFYDCVFIINDKGERNAYSLEYLAPVKEENPTNHIYGVVQFYQLDSGESSLHIDGYSTPESAKKALVREVEAIKEEIDDNGYEVSEELNDGDDDVYIRDTGDNRYSFKLERIYVDKGITL